MEQAKKYGYDKDEYYRLRDYFNEGNPSKLEEAALFLYFNKTGFNGLYRVNSKNKFNVPIGRYKSPTVVDEDKILAGSQSLQDIEIYSKDYTYVLDDSSPGDLVYFDPPYQPVSETSYFTAYTMNGFGMKEQRELYDTCIALDNKDVNFVLSNSYASQIVEMYESVDKFRMKIVEAKRSINSKASKRGPVKEILVTNIK